MSQLAQNNLHLSLYREVGSFLNHLELPTLAKEYRKIEKSGDFHTSLHKDERQRKGVEKCEEF